MTLLLFFLLLLTLSVMFVSSDRDTLTRLELEETASSFARDFSERIRLSIEGLQVPARVLLFFEETTLEQFQAITEQNFVSDPGLLVIEWQPVIPGDQRRAFEQRVRASGLSEFRLWEPGPDGTPIEAQDREEHVPVLFMRTKDVTEDLNTLGIDLAWSPERMGSKLGARDSGRAQGSVIFPVVTGQDTDYRPLGFAITVPVYRDGLIPLTVAERRDQLVGYLAAVYTLEDLLADQLAQFAEQGFNLIVHDGEAGGERFVRSFGTDSDQSTEVQIDIFGTTFYAEVTATRTHLNQQFQFYWVLLPLGLVLYGALVFWFMTQLERKNTLLTQAANELEEAYAQLDELSRRDSLTQLYNRRAALEQIYEELERDKRHPKPLTLIIMDIDLFKQVNDQYGHAAGDLVLRAFAQHVQKATRTIDVLGRIGGEEFVLMMVETDAHQAKVFAERLRLSIADLDIPLEGKEESLRVTVSMGISSIDEPVSLGRWLKQADQALYQAKDEGRNCVRVYTETKQPS